MKLAEDQAKKMADAIENESDFVNRASYLPLTSSANHMRMTI
jgi:hypothetical protein